MSATGYRPPVSIHQTGCKPCSMKRNLRCSSFTSENDQEDGRIVAGSTCSRGRSVPRQTRTTRHVMLEDGCEEFSNIAGLGQIRFPKGNISAAFEEFRATLEREGLIVSVTA